MDPDHRGENIALIVLAAVVALIVGYAMLVRPDARKAVKLFSESDKTALAAVIRATGQECERVCAAAADDPSTGAAQLLVSCSVAGKKMACKTARQFEISVAPAAEPSR